LLRRREDASAAIERCPLEHRSVNCQAVYGVKLLHEGEKATFPLAESCPVCSMPYDRLWADNRGHTRA